MTRLEDSVNIGAVLAGELRRAGITTTEELRRLGARRAWERVQQINPDRNCTSSLLALEGAVRGVRWMTIPRQERERFLATVQPGRQTR